MDDDNVAGVRIAAGEVGTLSLEVREFVSLYPPISPILCERFLSARGGAVRIVLQ